MHNPDNGFISSVWGPALWMVLHCISLNYPLQPTKEDKYRYRKWFEGLQHVLPCRKCRQNFKTNLHSIHYHKAWDFHSRFRFSHLVYRLHNNVRQRQGKSTQWSFETCMQTYEQFRAKDCTEDTDGQEGGCVASKPLSCTLYITPDIQNAGRYQIDPGCGIQSTDLNFRSCSNPIDKTTLRGQNPNVPR